MTFHELDNGTTRLMYQMDFEPTGLVESVGAVTGLLERTVAGDLERFKKFIEARGTPSVARRNRDRRLNGSPSLPLSERPT